MKTLLPLVIAPLALGLAWGDAPPTLVFFMSLLAIVPLVGVIGSVTETLCFIVPAPFNLGTPEGNRDLSFEMSIVLDAMYAAAAGLRSCSASRSAPRSNSCSLWRRCWCSPAG